MASDRVEQCVAQLEEISQRRNVLLRQMYQMIQRKNVIGAVLPTHEDEADYDGIDAFLERFDLNEHPENGSITTLSKDELDVPLPISTVNLPDDAEPESDDALALGPTADGEFGGRSSTQSRAKQPQKRYRPRPEQDDSDRDELDFLSSTPRSASRHRSPSQLHTRSRSASRPASVPVVSEASSPIVIEILDSLPPSPEIIDVDAVEDDIKMEVLDVDVEDATVSEVNVAVADADVPPRLSPPAAVEELVESQADQPPDVKENTPPPVEEDDAMVLDDVEDQPPASPPTLIAAIEDEPPKPNETESPLTPDRPVAAESPQEESVASPSREDSSKESPSKSPQTLTPAIEGPLTPVEEVIPESAPAAPTTEIPKVSPEPAETIRGTPAPPSIDETRSPSHDEHIAMDDETAPEEPTITPAAIETTVDQSVDQPISSPISKESEELGENDIEMTAPQYQLVEGLVSASPVETTHPNIVEEPMTDASAIEPIREPEAPQQVTTISPAALFMPPAAISPRRPPILLIGPRSPALEDTGFVFDTVDNEDVDLTGSTTSTTPQPDKSKYHHFDPQYTLPPLKSLPAEYQRKGKLTKAQRKKERERREREKEKDGANGVKEGIVKDDGWTPMGMNRWAAMLNANPVYVKVSKASKCLLTRDWGTAFTELRLIRTFSKIENLKDAGQWSFRQPKKQRGVGGLVKTHWDYLMDEMKWMRIDFREERRWKLALAYNLSTAVLEWHAAGNTATRIAKGICVKWKPPKARGPPAGGGDDDMVVDSGGPPSRGGFTQGPDQGTTSQHTQQQQQNSSDSQLKPMNPLSILNYNSDDDDDDDPDQDQMQDQDQDVTDALDTSALIDDALELADRDRAASVEAEANGSISMDNGGFKPKTEEMDDSSALQNENAMDVDRLTHSSTSGVQGSSALQQQKVEEHNTEADTTMHQGLKKDSVNPMLMDSTATSRSSGEPSSGNNMNSKAGLKNIYAPIREKIAYSGLDKLFLDFDDLDITKDDISTNREPAVDEVSCLLDAVSPPTDLSAIFPDLQPYGLFDVAPSPPASVTGGDSKKKSEKRSDRDDPNKRAEDTTYSKLVPIGKFMHCKPTLLGPLQPSKKWKDGQWVQLDDYVVAVEEGPPSKPLDIFSDLFENNKPLTIQPLQLPKDYRRTSEAVWTPSEDGLLKTLSERYPNNWPLIAECFNSARVALSTDKRTPRDCLERWDALWGPGSQSVSADGSASTPMTPTMQMTTRGVKRLASVSAAGSSALPNASEPRKRRRHILVHDAIRKLTRQRLATAQKNAMAQRKPTIVHETHSQYNKLPKMTPAELGRLKAEKEARESAELATVKRKQEELRLQQMQRLQMAANGQQAAIPHPPQVGIAQHQRISTPISANSRLSPQQVAQAQAQAQLQQRNLMQAQQTQALPVQQNQVQALVQAQQQAQAQNQVQAAQGQNSPPSINGTASNAVLNNGQLAAQAQLPQNAVTAANAHGTYASPPRSTGTPSNAATSPRPQSAQAQVALLHATQMQQASQLQQQAANTLQRPGSNIAYYMSATGTPYTAEQLNAMRLQLMQQQAQQAAQAQAAQAQAQQHLQQGSTQGSS